MNAGPLESPGPSTVVSSDPPTPSLALLGAYMLIFILPFILTPAGLVEVTVRCA